jgi:hypothetical protein
MSRGVYFDPGSTRQNRQRDGLYYKARFLSIFLCFLAFLYEFVRILCRVVYVVALLRDKFTAKKIALKGLLVQSTKQQELRNSQWQ